MPVYGFCVCCALKHSFCNKLYCQILNVEVDFFQVFQTSMIKSFWNVGMLVARKRLICAFAHKKNIQKYSKEYVYFT